MHEETIEDASALKEDWFLHEPLFLSLIFFNSEISIWEFLKFYEENENSEKSNLDSF